MDTYKSVLAKKDKTRAIHAHAYNLGDTLTSTQYEIENSQTQVISDAVGVVTREKTNT